MTTKAVAQRGTTTALSIQDGQTEFNQQQVATLAQLGVANASRGDLAVFFHQAVRTGLDPSVMHEIEVVNNGPTGAGDNAGSLLVLSAMNVTNVEPPGYAKPSFILPCFAAGVLTF